MPDSSRRLRAHLRGNLVAYAALVGMVAFSPAPSMAADLVTTGDIANGAVTQAKLATDSVTSGKVLNDTLGGGDIRNGSVAAIDILDGTIRSADVADGSINGHDLNLFNDDQCTGETVQGTAVVVTYPILPNSFTTDGVGYAHSCSGEAVTVKRREAGVYEVDFGAGSTSRLAMVTANNAGFLASAFNLAAGRFEVRIFYYAGFYADSDFSILAY